MSNWRGVWGSTRTNGKGKIAFILHFILALHFSYRPETVIKFQVLISTCSLLLLLFLSDAYKYARVYGYWIYVDESERRRKKKKLENRFHHIVSPSHHTKYIVRTHILWSGYLDMRWGGNLIKNIFFPLLLGNFSSFHFFFRPCFVWYCIWILRRSTQLSNIYTMIPILNTQQT